MDRMRSIDRTDPQIDRSTVSETDRPIRSMWIDRSLALRAPHAQTSFSLFFTHSTQELREELDLWDSEKTRDDQEGDLQVLERDLRVLYLFCVICEDL